MLNDLTPAQRALADYMSDLSEAAFCAGWMMGLEYALWEAVLGSRDSYGHLALTPEHTTRLRRLSAACDGWIIFDDEHEESWISTVSWARLFSTWKETGGG